MNEQVHLVYAVVLVIVGLTLITGRNRIAEFRNRHALEERDRWGTAEPRRYLFFGILFILLGVASVVWP